jgi:hypothetical protein
MKQTGVVYIIAKINTNCNRIITMFIKLLIISLLALTIAVLFFGLRMLLKNNGSFPEIHISRNREMLKRGIRCGGETDLGCTSADYRECSVCGKKPPEGNSGLKSKMH